jgi:UDP-glucose 4-epimerase
MKVIVLGGAGYIGTHTCVSLLEKNHEILVIDNLLNGSLAAIDRVKYITNKHFKFVKGDIRDRSLLSKVMSSFKPDAVMHFAGLKAVGESTQFPLEYYDVNVRGSIEVLKAMEVVDCNLFIFSSSATVYGIAEYLPFDERHPLVPTNPYGQSKLIVEKILKDWVKAKDNNRAICLRYFNPVGAHASGLIGEDTESTPNNLMPYISQVASGRREILTIFGDDYETRDGTGERDYIHVSDLANGHLLALEKYKALEEFQVLNLGTGTGTTVKELIQEFERSTKQKIKIQILGRRQGDVAKSYANNSQAKILLGFNSEKTVSDMCKDTWNWQQKNPNGYQ